MARRRTKKGLCPGCLHGLEHHPDKGPCRYGHDPVDPNGRKTAAGGCQCPGFGSRKVALGEITLSPIEELERMKNAVQTALDAFCAHVRAMLVPPTASNGTSIETTAEIDRLLKVLPARDAIRDALRNEEAVKRGVVETEREVRNGQNLPPRDLPAPRALREEPTEAERKILVQLAQDRSHTLSRKRIAMRAGYSHGSGRFGQHLSDMKACGWITGDRTAFTITPEGRLALGPFEKMPTGVNDVVTWWVRRCNETQGLILRCLQGALSTERGGLTREEIADIIQREAGSGRFGQHLSDLKTLGVIVKKNKTEFALAPEMYS